MFAKAKKYIKFKIYKNEFINFIPHYDGPKYPSDKFPIERTKDGPKLRLERRLPKHLPKDCYNDVLPPKTMYALKYENKNPSKLFIWAQKHL